ncbi:MAG: hydroxymethylbilane synthase [Gammaproteobacteria bacterium]
MSINRIRITTRESPLALWQAEHVRAELIKCHTGLEVELIGITTQGDIILDKPLMEVGGKGLFIKELEQVMLDGNADIAVHSMKDVTIDFPPGLSLPVIMQREDPRDVLISNKYDSLDDLPEGAVIGTSSLRRQCQLKSHRPDFRITTLRGNVGTRLKKLDEGQYDAIILASAGVTRLGLTGLVKQYISVDVMLPAVGQGAIGIETRSEDKDVIALISPLSDTLTTTQMQAERAFSKKLYGGCHLPIAALATIEADTLSISGLVGEVDGSRVISGHIQGPVKEAVSLGERLGESLLEQGADEILRKLLND